MAGKWTDEQQTAINVRNSSVIVSASAGSGKTSVLIARLLALLSDTENKIPVEKIAVVTFTNDAAAEMKKRLTVGLSELIDHQPDNQWLYEQQAMLQYAKICTIHSFCFDLIRDNIQILDISSGFRIMEENEEKVIVNTVAENVLEKAYTEIPQEINKLYNYFCTNSDDKLIKFIITVRNYIENIPFWKLWVEKVLELYETGGHAENIYVKEYIDFVKNNIEEIIHSINGLIVLSERLHEEKVDLLFNSEKKAVEAVYNEINSEKFSVKNICTLMSEIKFKAFPTKRKDVNEPEYREYIKNKRTEYKEKINQLFENANDVLIHAEEDMNAHYEIMSTIKMILIELKQQIWDVKVKKNAIGFNDAEQLAIKLLADVDEDGTVLKSKIAKELSAFYKVIMVDEFQDTNNNQDLIFKLLSDSSEADKIGSNVFFVGDVKQSIYRFRMANPKLFINKMLSAKNYGENHDGEMIYIKLNKNFRSSKGVVDFVNYIFTNIMSEETGEVNYGKDEKLIQGAEYPDNMSCSTQIVLIPKDKADKTNYEALYVAGQISKMLKEKYPVSNKDGIGTRPCEMRDFCVLLRNRKNSAEYIAAFEKYNISAYAEETAGYLKSREVSVLLNFLRVIDNPLLETALASVMLSQMFMFSVDDIAGIRLVNRKTNLFLALCEGIGEKYNSETENNTKPILDGELLVKAKYIYTTINEMRMYSVSSTLEELIRKIYDSTDFLSVMQIYKDSEKRKANLRILLEYAKSYEESTNGSVSGGITGFLRFIDNILKIGKDFKKAPSVSSSENVVMIKTIHKSKGLEFPFVFLVETDTKFSNADRKSNIQFHSEKGFGFRLQNKEKLTKYTTIPYETISNKNESDAVSEEMRLLYVALTRARDRLFISFEMTQEMLESVRSYAVDIKGNKKISSHLIRSVKSMSEWLLMSLIMHKNSLDLRRMASIDENIMMSDDETSIEYVLYDHNDKIETDNKSQTFVEPDTYISEIIRRNVCFNYNSRLSILPAKLSVSEISKQNEMDFALKRPKFISETSKLTPTEKGTALHCFLQYADFNCAEINPENEIQKLISYGYLTQKQGNNIDIQKLKNFFNSELYKRIKKSDTVMREKKFMIKISELELINELGCQYKNTDGMLYGIIDLVFFENNNFILVDYKTDYVKDLQLLADDYSIQLLLYKKAFEIISGKKVQETYIYSFSMDSYIEII